MIKAIETRYNGYRFRSRLEARWAVFFDALKVKYEYEKEGYDLSGVKLWDAFSDPDVEIKMLPPKTWYLPDFWLPEIDLRGGTDGGLWLEIKGTEPTDKENDKCHGLYVVTDRPVVLAVGPPEIDKEDMYQIGPYWDNYMQFTKCFSQSCRRVKVEFLEGNYMTCPYCGARSDNDHPGVLQAISAARGARFEHGETPRV